jgi:hypothetical protein
MKADKKVVAAEQAAVALSTILMATREAAINEAANQYGALRKYAAACNELFGILPTFDGKYWFNVDGNAKGSEFTAIHAEWALFREGLVNNKCKNVSVYRKRLRELAYAESGLAPETTTEIEGAEGEGAEGEGAGDKARPIKGRMLEELGKLYKARFNEKYASEITDEIRAATKHIEQALLALGANLNDLVK